MPVLGPSLQLLGITDGSVGPPQREGNDTLTISDVLIATQGHAATSSDTLNMSALCAYTPGVILTEVLRTRPALAATLISNWTAEEQIHVVDALRQAELLLVSEGIGLNAATTALTSIRVLESLGVLASPLPSMVYTLGLVQGLALSDSLRNFFGGDVLESIGVSELIAPQLRATGAATEMLGIGASLASTLYVRVVAMDTIGIDDVDALQMIYSPVLTDEVEITAGYVAPDGGFTTWAINTRSGAVTEYDNYAFNSFAQMGHVYIGASSEGLYELTGDDDDGASIVAQLKSGFAQWAGTRLTGFKGAYLGVRGGGSYVLKLETGDGKTYTYAVSAKDMATTKVTLGKGLRARYFAFELISAGQDFDLDTVEFVPLVSQRRV